MAAVGEGREEEKRRADFSSSPCRHNQQNMAVLCRHVVTSMARGGVGGGTFGESVFFFFFSVSPFCAPCVNHRLAGGTSAAASGVLPRRVRCDASAASFECNFSSPTLFIDFDLRDSDVGVPPPRLLPSDSGSGCICRRRVGAEKLTWRRPMRGGESQAWLCLFRIRL